MEWIIAVGIFVLIAVMLFAGPLVRGVRGGKRRPGRPAAEAIMPPEIYADNTQETHQVSQPHHHHHHHHQAPPTRHEPPAHHTPPVHHVPPPTHHSPPPSPPPMHH